jgi:hypothetical protein
MSPPRKQRPDALKELDELIEQITVDAYGEDEQLWAFRQAFEDEANLPADGFVLGEPVSVIKIDYDGNERRGLTATCKKEDGSKHVVSLTDVAFGEATQDARYLAAYRKWAGLNPVSLPGASKKKHRASEADIDISQPVGLIVLNVKERAARCRIPGTQRVITFRSRDVWKAIPGEILTVRANRYWRYSATSYLSGVVESRKIDIPALGLTPLALEERGMWDPADECWGDEGEPLPEWAKPIIRLGPRPQFEMGQVIPGEDPEDPFEDPVLRANDLKAAGELDEAYRLLMEMAEADLRCLDVHSHLGNMAFDRCPEDALRHYEVGMRVGELSLGQNFEGVLPWGYIDNRPFLRCMHGYGLVLWRLERFGEAEKVFERMLWLNPTDNQGVRFVIEPVKTGETWKEEPRDRRQE